MLDDLGLTIKALEARNTLVLGSAAGLIDDRQAAAAQKALAESAMQARPILTYLANTMRVGDREVPYSLVTALDLTTIPVTGSSRTVTNGTNAPSGPDGPSDPIVLNSWAAAELGARSRRPAHDGVLRVGGAWPARHTNGHVSRGWNRARRARATETWRRRSRASAIRRRSRSGIPRFRSTCAAYVQPTRSTGGGTRPRPRRSCRSRPVNGCGDPDTER